MRRERTDADQKISNPVLLADGFSYEGGATPQRAGAHLRDKEGWKKRERSKCVVQKGLLERFLGRS